MTIYVNIYFLVLMNRLLFIGKICTGKQEGSCHCKSGFAVLTLHVMISSKVQYTTNKNTGVRFREASAQPLLA
jgi:hypothetical protein